MNAQINQGALARLGDFLLDFLGDLRHDLLDAGGVDAAVRHELVQGEACNFATHRVEAAQYDGFRRIVHDEFNPCGGLEGANVPSFSADDAAFDVVVFDLEDRDAVFDAVLCGDALNGLDDNLLGFCVGALFGFVDDVLGLACGHATGFRLDLLDHGRLGLVGRHAAELLQGVDGLVVVGIKISLPLFQRVEALVEFLLVFFELTVGVFVLVNGPLKVGFGALDALLAFVQFAVKVLALMGLLFLQFNEFLFGLKDFLFLDGFSAEFGFANNAVGFASQHAQEEKVACASSEKESGGCGEYGAHGV